MHICQRCQEVFEPHRGEAAECPKCGSREVREMPTWTPIGFTVSGSPTWEYECQGCRQHFKLPVPSSPSEEKAIKCPGCGGGHIHRVTALGGEPVYCG